MTAPPAPTLLSIVAHARSGALVRAWAMFEAGGFEERDEAGALTVKGRLLKDRALAASGAARREFYQRAAAAYGRAGELGGGQTYPFINAATLSLLAGDAEGARARAARVLALIEAGEDGPETPYWRAATRAEALLLLGRADEARDALADAVGAAPRAWEDHASTLRQFGLILAEQGADAAWLDAHRPPRALHFAGHMALGADTADLAARVAMVLAEERIGFGHGALAAGADIVIAEALLAHGAELHLVLPAPPADFAAASVAPFGGDWAARFEAVLARADTVRVAGLAGSGAAGHQLAAEATMGCAAMQARALMTEALQLLVLDGRTADAAWAGGSAWMESVWMAAGRRGRVLVAPRLVGPKSPAAGVEFRLAAMVEARVADPGRLADGLAARLGQVLSGAPMLTRPRWTASGLSLTFAEPAAAAAAMLAIAKALVEESFQVAGHYGVARAIEDPFGGGEVLLGEAGGLPGRILASTPPGALLVSDDFACALAAGPARGQPHTEYVGDLAAADPEQAIRLFSLSDRPA